MKLDQSHGAIGGSSGREKRKSPINWRGVPVARGTGRFARLQATAVVNVARVLRALTGQYGTQQQADLSNLKIVCHSHEFVIFVIPKAGTKSLQRMMRASPPGTIDFEFHRLAVRDLLQKAPRVARYYQAAFVRNPWRRVVSCYEDKVLDAHQLGKVTILSRFPGLTPGMPFEAFVEWLLSPFGSDGCADRHWISQHRLVGLDAEKPGQCDFIGKIETMAEDWRRLSKNLHLPTLDMPHANRSQAPRDLDYYYTPYTRALVAERYRSDIDLFKYRFED